MNSIDSFKERRKNRVEQRQDRNFNEANINRVPKGKSSGGQFAPKNSSVGKSISGKAVNKEPTNKQASPKQRGSSKYPQVYDSPGISKHERFVVDCIAMLLHDGLSDKPKMTPEQRVKLFDGLMQRGSSLLLTYPNGDYGTLSKEPDQGRYYMTLRDRMGHTIHEMTGYMDHLDLLVHGPLSGAKDILYTDPPKKKSRIR